MSAFDLPFFTEELSKLFLKNQVVTLTILMVDGNREPVFSVALKACRRIGGKFLSTPYLSSSCLWRSLQHYDQASTKSDNEKSAESLHLVSFKICKYNLFCITFSIDFWDSQYFSYHLANRNQS